MTEISGSTTIVELMQRFPDGKALHLMARLSWPCGHCSGALDEPLSLAAKRHGNRAGLVVQAFRALQNGGPSEQLVAQAAQRIDRRPAPDALWQRYAK